MVPPVHRWDSLIFDISGDLPYLIVECAMDKFSFRYIAHLQNLCDTEERSHSRSNLLPKNVIIIAYTGKVMANKQNTVDFLPGWTSVFITNISVLTSPFNITKPVREIARYHSWTDLICTNESGDYGYIWKAVNATCGAAGCASKLTYSLVKNRNESKFRSAIDSHSARQTTVDVVSWLVSSPFSDLLAKQVILIVTLIILNFVLSISMKIGSCCF